jgi:leader peptidase (prepilin peptidase)/N-methyltransferase
VIIIDLPVWMLVPFLFALGAIVGSFLNVCVYRLPKKEGLWESLQLLWNEPSHCRRCHTAIRWHDNVPIFGWLALRGRCRTCRAWISPRYPTIELLNALLFVLLYWAEIGFGFSVPLDESCLNTNLGPQVIPGLGPLSPTTFALIRYAYHLVLIDALLVASLIDIDLRIIPDGVTVPAMIFAIVGAFAVGRMNLVPVWFQSVSLFVSDPPAAPAWVFAHPHLHGLACSLAGLAVGWSMVWVVRFLGQWALKREAMGFGDVILMGMIGSFIGWQPTVIVFFAAPPIALCVYVLMLFVKREQVIPYGPYLSLGTLATFLFWQILWPAWERIFAVGPILIPIAAVGVVVLGLFLYMATLIKRLLGIAHPDDEFAVWTAADQNSFLAGEQSNLEQGRWKKSPEWPGIYSGRGQQHWKQWRER